MIGGGGMLQLQNIKTNYNFQEAEWKIEGELIKTERGLKRIIKWANKDEATWHVKWRDQLFFRTNLLTDRMLQTIHGERVQMFGDGWITLHDEVTSLFSYQKFEKKMGEFLGKYYSNSFQMDVSKLKMKEYSMTTFPKTHLKQLEFMKKRKNDSLIASLRKEGLLRLWKAEKLAEKHEEVPLPIICSIKSLEQGRAVNENFFWQHECTSLEKGFRSLKIVLSQWLQRFGEKSLLLLLTEIDKFFAIKKTYHLPFMIECLLPWELIEYVEQVNQIDNEEDLEKCIEKLKNEWENNRKLLKVLNEWLNVKEERVPL